MVKLLKNTMVHEKLVNTLSNRISVHKETDVFCLDGIVATMKSKAGPTYRVLDTV